MVWVWNGFLYGLSQANLGVYGLSQDTGHPRITWEYTGYPIYGLSQDTGYPSIRAVPVYGLSQVNLGVYGLSQDTGYPSIRAIPVYGLSQYTGYPRIRAIPVYGLSQDTGHPSIRAVPVYGLSQVNLGVYGLSQYTGYPRIRAIPVYGPLEPGFVSGACQQTQALSADSRPSAARTGLCQRSLAAFGRSNRAKLDLVRDIVRITRPRENKPRI
ncbi:hypothetical protein DdX_12394 [Ditylenchus destructor]|uniref:Uncharacterized protein n=1 Tax=Ditylenchus destructor TaxID=166010 RepID=A0AAD4R3J4_9BILA|nr:hypothetical protein DdX_12394 [Ditylenchus destructor]